MGTSRGYHGNIMGLSGVCSALSFTEKWVQRAMGYGGKKRAADTILQVGGRDWVKGPTGKW